MTRTSLLSLAALCGFVNNTVAFAAAPHPTAIDADHDGAYAASVDVNGDSAKDHLDIGVRASQYDCDDAHSTVSPRNTEVVGDGIDNDCSGADAYWPPGVTEEIAKRFLANSGAKSGVILIAEYDACKAATECEVDTVGGKFKIVAAAQDTHKFADIYVNGSKVLRNNGQRPDGREVVTVEEFEHFRGGSVSGSGSSYSGPTKATRLAEATSVAAPLVAAEAEVRRAADSEHDRRLGVIETGNTGRDEELNRLADVDYELEKRIAASEGAIAAETTRAQAAESALSGRVIILDNDVSNLGNEVIAQGTSGIAVNAGIAGGFGTQRERVFDGQTIRGDATGLVGFDATVHVDLDEVVAGPFATVAWGSDGIGTGADASSLIGFEALGDVQDSGHHLGGFGAWRHTEAMSTALDVGVPANGGCGGFSYRFTASAAGHAAVSPWLRVGPCLEAYASKHARLADEQKTVEVIVAGGDGWGMTAMMGVSFNLTSVRDR